ncbi:hypothetical protein RCH06_000459 [Polaromonas sp. CG_9.5]|nr:hypothetical protein [Polaromonas sp. CG_9.5]
MQGVRERPICLEIGSCRHARPDTVAIRRPRTAGFVKLILKGE